MIDTTEKLSFFERLKAFFHALLTLSKMQLKEKFNFSFKGNFRKTLFKTVWFFVEFIIITVACYIILYFLQILKVFSNYTVIPVSVMGIVYTFMFLLSVIATTSDLTKSLYFSKDNQVLLTLPSTPSLVFLSKLVVYFIRELKKSFMFLVPLFVAYGVVQKLPIIYFIWLLFLFVFLSVLPVVISALLSIPYMYVYRFVKKIKGLQYALIGALIIALGIIAVKLISLIPVNVDLVKAWGSTFYKIQSVLRLFEKKLSVFYGLATLIAGVNSGVTVKLFTNTTVLKLVILIAVIILGLALSLILAKPLFYKMASKSFEFNKKSDAKIKRSKKTGKFLAVVKKEFIVGMRDNSLIVLSSILMVVLPIVIMLLNKIYSAMNTRFVGQQMATCFTFLIILLIMLSTNISVASVYSRDGFSAYLNKIQPTSYTPILLGKLVLNLLIGLVGTVITVITYSTFTNFNLLTCVFFAVSVYGIYVAHLFWSAELDIMNPQTEQYATFNEQSNNSNENKSAILLFIISFIFFVIMLMLTKENVNVAWIKAGVISLVLAISKITSFIMKITAFYKEKQ